jgi:hypothetical protein
VSYTLCAVNIYRQCVVWPKSHSLAAPSKAMTYKGGAQILVRPN